MEWTEAAGTAVQYIEEHITENLPTVYLTMAFHFSKPFYSRSAVQRKALQRGR